MKLFSLLSPGASRKVGAQESAPAKKRGLALGREVASVLHPGLGAAGQADRATTTTAEAKVIRDGNGMRLKGKVAIITGGTRGLGRTMAIMMAKEGAKVAFTGRSVDAAREVEERIREVGGTGMFVRADNKKEDEIKAAVEKVAAEYGPITILVNNAIASDDVGSGRDSHVDQIEKDILDQIIGAALYGAIWYSKYAIPHMRRAGGGSIINISASSSVGSIPARPAYQASKGAINSLTRQMAFDYGKEGIRTNTIVVGFVPTGSDSFKRMLADPEIVAAFKKLVCTPQLGEPSDIAYGAIYLASDESKYVTGSQLFIEGGALCHQSQPDLQLGRRTQVEKNAILDASGG
jgi:NAD(P)-dependent dehydrogenase (short-subunit alcohol dehydrogenase family)